MRLRSGVLYRRLRERERDLDLDLLLFPFGVSYLSVFFLSLGRLAVCELVGAVGLGFPFGLGLGCVSGCATFVFFRVFLLRCCFPRVRVDFTPPILGGGFSGGGARAVPVRIREEAIRLFPTGSREFSGARLVSSACTRLDTSAIVGRSERRVSHSYSASARHAR